MKTRLTQVMNFFDNFRNETGLKLKTQISPPTQATTYEHVRVIMELSTYHITLLQKSFNKVFGTSLPVNTYPSSAKTYIPFSANLSEMLSDRKLAQSFKDEYQRALCEYQALEKILISHFQPPISATLISVHDGLYLEFGANNITEGVVKALTACGIECHAEKTGCFFSVHVTSFVKARPLEKMNTLLVGLLEPLRHSAVDEALVHGLSELSIRESTHLIRRITHAQSKPVPATVPKPTSPQAEAKNLLSHSSAKQKTAEPVTAIESGKTLEEDSRASVKLSCG